MLYPYLVEGQPCWAKVELGAEYGLIELTVKGLACSCLSRIDGPLKLLLLLITFSESTQTSASSIKAHLLVIGTNC